MEFDKEQLAPDNGDAINGVVAKGFPGVRLGRHCHVGLGTQPPGGLSVHNRLGGYHDKIIATGHSRAAAR